MQAVDLSCNSTLDPSAADRTTMSESSPIHFSDDPGNRNSCVENTKEDNVKKSSNSDNNVVVRRERPSRACTQRAAARMQAAAEAEAAMAEKERKRKKAKRREKLAARLVKELSGYEDNEEEEVEDGCGQAEEEVGEGEEEDGEQNGSLSLSPQQCSKIITPLVGEPEPSQLPRWNIRSMWQLASVLNFLNVFRHLLNIKVEFSAEEFETALITPNNTLADIHMPLLKAIPPVTRMALGHGTWITVLCRKLRDWWHWVAEGDLPIVASHGAEVEAYSALDPGVRVVILKALCDIRVEQEDIRSFIDDSIKHGVPISVFRKERVGGDSHGISYWYEDDAIIGQRLYRDIRKVEVKKGKGKNIPPIPHSCYQWEAVATNLEEFQTVSEKLVSSKNRTEVSVGKKLKRDMLPEVEKVHKKKEKLLKKQHREALMLDNLINIDSLGAGRSLRYRKPVTYTFDDYDRSISEAIKVTKKKHPSPEPFDRRDPHVKQEASTNGGWSGPSQYSQHLEFSSLSPKSPDNDEFSDHQNAETLDFSNRPRQRPQRLNEFVEAVSDYEADSDSDDDIVGEVVYDEEYLRSRKKRRKTSSSSGDEEYIGDEDNPEEEEEEEEEDEDTSSTSDDSDDKPRKYKPLPSRTRREAKLRSVDELQSGLRRSKRATRTHIDYRQIEMSESENESLKPEKSNALDERPTGSDNEEFSMGSRDSESRLSDEKREMQVDQLNKEHQETNYEINDEDQTHLTHPPDISNEIVEDKVGVQKRHFLDLNELAPGSGFDDVPNCVKDEDADNF